MLGFLRISGYSGAGAAIWRGEPLQVYIRHEWNGVYGMGMKFAVRAFVARSVKHLMGMVLYQSGLHRLAMPNCAIVVLFHRVNDRLGENEISCTVKKFRDFCDFFKKYYKVISYGELLRKLDRGENLRGHVVITFDDGYRDNEEVAAADLRKRGLTACFFIITGFIGTDRVAWWDEEKGIKSEWMSWDSVRALREQGFELGCHTVNHLDLGKVHGDEAQWEIEESKRKLEAETGEKIPYFSYPYGGIDQCTEENRQRVRDLGFKTCPSAYGGVVPPGTDPFYIKRTSISQWYISPYHFGVDMMLLGRRAEPNDNLGDETS